MPAHILVTGGAGSIGAILTEHLLAAGHTVTVLDNLRSGGGSVWHLCAQRRFDLQGLPDDATRPFGPVGPMIVGRAPDRLSVLGRGTD